MSRLSSVKRLLPLLGLALLLTACWAPVQTDPGEDSPALTLRDQQLLRIIEREQELDARAAEPDAQFPEIQRLFHDVDEAYGDFLSRNPDDLEAFLLYGKLLLKYNDLEGARDRFLAAAAIAERSGQQIAVIHQQLATICAEEGDYSRAVVFADNAIKIEPAVPAYHYGLGQILAAYRKELIDDQVFPAEEIDQLILLSFKTAMDLDPQSIPLRFRYGEAFYDVGNPDWNAALLHWQSLATDPQLSALQLDATRLHQARCLLELGLPDQARQITRLIASPQLLHSAQDMGLGTRD